VKLVLHEPESEALAGHLAESPARLVTSGLAVVEVERGAWVGSGGDLEARAEARRLVASCLLIDVGSAILRAAAALASETLRTLDAIHLASAQLAEPDEVLVYDIRLREAAASLGLVAIAPGASG
jgi:predicted nucleic acid-binding protein